MAKSSAKLTLDLSKLLTAFPSAMPKIAQELAASNVPVPSFMKWLTLGSSLLGEVITTDGNEELNIPFNIGPEGQGLGTYWRTHPQWTDEQVCVASESVLTQEVPTEFQPTADRVIELIKYTTSVLTDGAPPSSEQYRKAVDAILREANTSGIRRYGDMLMYTLKLRGK